MTQEVQLVFDYGALDTATRLFVEQRTEAIRGLMKRAAEDIIQIGGYLSEVKEKLGHGQWEAWLRTEFDWSLSAAVKFIQVHARFKSVNFTDFRIAPSALYLLSAPSTPESVRNEAIARAELGQPVTHAVAKDLKESAKVVEQKAIPEVKEAVRNGKLPVSVGAAVAQKPAPVQQAEAAQIAAPTPERFQQILKEEIERAERKAEERRVNREINRAIWNSMPPEVRDAPPEVEEARCRIVGNLWRSLEWLGEMPDVDAFIPMVMDFEAYRMEGLDKVVDWLTELREKWSARNETVV